MTRQSKWAKENLKYIRGLRAKRDIYVEVEGRPIPIIITDKDFLVRQGKSQSKPFRIYGTETFVHVPLSLCNRARISINKDGKIVAKSRCYTRNK